MEYALENAKDSDCRRLYLRRHGIERLSEGSYIYVAGDTVIGLPEGISCVISPDVKRIHLNCDLNLPVKTAAIQLCEALHDNDEVLLPVWGFLLIGSIRSMFNTLGNTTFPTLFIEGKQGFGKSTVCKNYLLLYDDVEQPGRIWGELDATSTQASVVNLISQYRDQVIAIDDVAKSGSAAEEHKRKDLGMDILRFSSNSSDRNRMDSHQNFNSRFCQVGVAITSENSLKNPSDLSRTISVMIETQMTGYSPLDRKYAATTFYHFLEWLMPRLDMAINYLSDQLAKVVDGQNQRLRKGKMMILWALHLFYEYVREIGSVTTTYAESEMNNANQILDRIIDKQVKACMENTCSGNVSWYIFEGYLDKKLNQVSKKEFKKRNKLPRYPYYEEDGAIVLDMNVLLTYMRNETPHHIESTNALGKLLRGEGAIVATAEQRSASKRVYVDGIGNNGEKCNKCKRFLKLNIATLKKAAQKY